MNAAVACGADAVYLGLEGFNARMKADNFNSSDIAKHIKRAHFFGVKVYVTVNTILQNQEFKPLLDMVKAAVLAKADAFIVQDVGVALVLKKAFPNIRLHASTQLGVHNAEGAKMAEKLGFCRVVLSRETTLEDIKQIRANCSLELEFFVHGALCVAFSGNCYLSAAECGASGNRGLCRQLCRRTYVAELGEKTQTGALLSARDLCLANSLKDLAEAGVTSFKIEGRMRREGYVAQTVSTYRRMLDSLIADGKAELSPAEERGLALAFNRGEFLTRAYLDGDVPMAIEKRFSAHIGVPIGKVTDVSPFKKELFCVRIASDRPLRYGDGLKFFDGEREAASLGMGAPKEVKKGIYEIVTAVRVEKGWSVHLIYDCKREADLLGAKRYVPIKLKLSAKAGELPTLEAECTNRDGRLIFAKAVGEKPLEFAQTSPLSEESLAAQICKTADSGFRVVAYEINTDRAFAPKSEINALRRSLFEKLSELVVEANSPAPVSVDEDMISRVCNANFPPSAPPVARLNVVREAADFKHGALNVLCPEGYTPIGVKKLLPASGSDDFALRLPVICNGKDMRDLNKLLEALPNIKTLVSENLYGLCFAEKGYAVIAGAGHNVSNDFAALAISSLGAKAVLPSLEYPNGLSARLDGPSSLLSAESSAPETSGLPVLSCAPEIPLMTLAHCPYKTLFDNECSNCSYKAGLTLSRQGRTYAVRRVRLSRCYFELYPSPSTAHNDHSAPHAPSNSRST